MEDFINYGPLSPQASTSSYTLDYALDYGTAGYPNFNSDVLFDGLHHYPPALHSTDADLDPIFFTVNSPFLANDERDEYEIEQDSSDSDTNLPTEQTTEARVIKRRKRKPKAAPHPVIISEPFACGVPGCRYAGASIVDLRNHFRSHNEDIVELQKQSRKLFKCAMCQKAYRAVNGIKYHLTNGMPDSTDVPGNAPRGRPERAVPKRKPPESNRPAASKEIAIEPMLTPAAHTPEMDELAAEDSPDEFLPEDEVEKADNAIDPALEQDQQPLAAVPIDRSILNETHANIPVRSTKKAESRIVCPIDGCQKQYKQINGLRYHLLKGHAKTPEEIDQFDEGLAKKIKGRKGSTFNNTVERLERRELRRAKKDADGRLAGSKPASPSILDEFVFDSTEALPILPIWQLASDM